MESERERERERQREREKGRRTEVRGEKGREGETQRNGKNFRVLMLEG
jgi:hypothetical protein